VGDAASNWERVGTAGRDQLVRPSLPKAYDAAALLLLAAQAAARPPLPGIAANILRVANEPGEEIHAGDLARGLESWPKAARSTMSAPPTST
jgi:branched-chain amino acid transport system substrate-binding protein